MVKDTEKINEGELWRSLLHRVVLPAPEGAEITTIKLFFLDKFLLLSIEKVFESLQLNSGNSTRSVKF